MKHRIPNGCIVIVIIALCFIQTAVYADGWIRINQLGYTTKGIKVAVWCSKTDAPPLTAVLVNQSTGKVVQTITRLQPYGAYGPFTQTTRIDFSSVQVSGRYYIRAGNVQSPVFEISDAVYQQTADFCLRYMRQQRSGFNPFLNDSCHTRDGYTLYGPMPDSSFMQVSGGWHDASDYLQYSTTSANATWHLLSAYKEFPAVFKDASAANGLEGSNRVPDILDEARWGLDWLLKMHPADDLLFNQVGDDRDHVKMRIPKEDSNYYGRGIERPVYFVSGKPQVRGKFLNATTGAASTAGKFASVFALASQLYQQKDTALATLLKHKALSAYAYGKKLPGVAQTASVRSPYIYAEGNWVDDMELAAATLYGSLLHDRNDHGYLMQDAFDYARQEPITPWLGKDTAAHYQWYPFVNAAHRELSKYAKDKQRDSLQQFYQEGISRVAKKAASNAFLRGIPFIWCSNNLTVAFAIQCYWYRQLTGDHTYEMLEQANIDWLFGCNPWGTSMVYGLPATGDTPVDPHSAFTHLKQYPIDGGLVDGPVYTSIYENLIGIQLNEPDEYAAFQSQLAVYHDDYGDYSTNEPTMDGTASLIYLLAAKENEALHSSHTSSNQLPRRLKDNGVIIRGDITKKTMALVFTADEFGEGLPFIQKSLSKAGVKASFFLTGRFYRNPIFQPAIRQLHQQGHYMGPHSDGHLLYNDWNIRGNILVSKDSLQKDLARNIFSMQQLGVWKKGQPLYLIPPYEWWNATTANWAKEIVTDVLSFTPGTRTNADYSWPEMGKSYASSNDILKAVSDFETKASLNGAILLIHAGTDTRRKDKFYYQLPELIDSLLKHGYQFVTIPELLNQ